eukprot:3382627-Pyramimonas_sp.AAC.1
MAVFFVGNLGGPTSGRFRPGFAERAEAVDQSRARRARLPVEFKHLVGLGLVPVRQKPPSPSNPG